MVKHYSAKGMRLTKGFEQLRLVAYQDPGGVWTNGYGHTRDVKAGDVCTPLAAEAWLIADLHEAERIVNSLVMGVDQLTQGQFDALVDLVFNVGGGEFSGSKMLAKVNCGDMEGAALEFRDWANVTIDGRKVKVAGLVRRRAAEEALFREVAA